MEWNHNIFLDIIQLHVVNTFINQSKNYEESVDNCLQNPLAPYPIFDLRAFVLLYLNHKRKTHQTATCYAGYYYTSSRERAVGRKK